MKQLRNLAIIFWIQCMFFLVNARASNSQEMIPKPSNLNNKTTEDSLQGEFYRKRFKTHISFRYGNFPNNSDVRYYGINVEYYFNNKWSISGPLYFGTTTNNVIYIHIPGTGIAAMTTTLLAVLASLGSDGEGARFLAKWGFRIGLSAIFTEKINYHIRLNDKVIISPYVSLIGIDITVTGDRDKNPTHVSLGWVGLKAKIHMTDRLTIGSDLSIRNFENWKIGYFAGIQLGYLLDKRKSN